MHFVPAYHPIFRKAKKTVVFLAHEILAGYFLAPILAVKGYRPLVVIPSGVQQLCSCH